MIEYREEDIKALGQILNSEKRAKLRQHQALTDAKPVWQEGGYHRTERHGYTGLLVKAAHEASRLVPGGNRDGRMTQNYWLRAYFQSGAERLGRIRDTLGLVPAELDREYGRTPAELLETAQAFGLDLARAGHPMPLPIVLNLVVIFVIDNAYLSYIREMNTIEQLGRILPYTVSLADALTKSALGVDALVCDGGHITGGLILSGSLPDEQLDHLKERMSGAASLFRAHYARPVTFVRASIKGEILFPQDIEPLVNQTIIKAVG